MFKIYKYRIYPTEEQKVMLAKTFGCCRYVYNWALDIMQQSYNETGKILSFYDLRHRAICLKEETAPWLNEVSGKSLQYAVNDLCDAYRRFFFGISGKPTYRKKNFRQHYHDQGGNVSIDYDNGLITIPKIKDIPCVFHRRLKGQIKQVGVELLSSGHYHVSLVVDNNIPFPACKPIEADKTIGIDTGLINFITTSDGLSVEPKRMTEKEKHKLKLLSRQLSKKEKGSRQFRVLKQRIARLHEHVKNRRQDYINKLTHSLVYDSQATTICVENLNVKAMQKNKHYSRSIRETAIGKFYLQLEYKCAWAGKNYIKIDRWAPSSKMCSHCGYVNKWLTMDVRQWTCPECGTHHNRDLNAAINIKHFGLSDKSPYPRYWGKVKPVEQPLVDDRSSEPKKLCCDSALADETGKLKGGRA